MNTHAFQEMIAPGCNSNPQGERLTPGIAYLASESNLLRAWERVRRNAGAAGVDGVTISDLEPQFPGLVRQLAAALVAGNYRPKPVLHVEVPKASGGTRKLGIPTVMDRVVQQAVLQVLQPVFDPRFSAQSFAYRPGRGPLDAIRHLQRRLSPHSGWVLHFDVKNFFDTVPHARILAVVSGQVEDPGLVALVRDFLCSGVFEFWLDEERFDELWRRLGAEMDAEEDVLIAYALDEKSARRRRCHGGRAQITERRTSYVL